MENKKEKIRNKLWYKKLKVKLRLQRKIIKTIVIEVRKARIIDKLLLLFDNININTRFKYYQFKAFIDLIKLNTYHVEDCF
jgi:hypothetical protein